MISATSNSARRMWLRPEFTCRGSITRMGTAELVRDLRRLRNSILPATRVAGFGPEIIMTSGSHSSYHALQTSLTKNSARLGLGVQASYTYAKSLDDTSAVLAGLLGSSGTLLQTAPQNPWDPSGGERSINLRRDSRVCCECDSVGSPGSHCASCVRSGEP